MQARTLFLQLALSASEQAPPTNAALQGEPQVADPDRSATRVRQWLQSIGLSTDTLQLENGAGLSRTERVRARLLGELLRWQWQQPTRFEFVASLPVAGVDGTLKQRVEEMLGREVDEVSVKNVVAMPPTTKVEVRYTENSN